MRTSRFLVFAALAVALLAAPGCKKKTVSRTASPPETIQGKNITEFHATITARTSSSLCMSCHGDMTDRETLSAGIPDFHRMKLDPVDGVLRTYTCTDCHRSVDLLEGSGGALGTQVDAQRFCYPCHDPEAVGPEIYQ